ncbi:hypothetical protein SK128_017633 [Halocaridina rubra]|uniref:Uncharacterized protein n=1 Tax=Halocaridina rubra TaxID=373956 RepID=A0AAN8WXW4_HALRR
MHKFVDMKVQYEKNKNLECHIEILSKENDELLQQLRAAAVSSTSNEIAEQRRKRVQELESQMAALKKEQIEQAKLLRIKEQSEQKISSLTLKFRLHFSRNKTGANSTRLSKWRDFISNSRTFRGKRWKKQWPLIKD